MDEKKAKCRVGIMRESKVSGGGCAFAVYVDGVKTTTIKNGGTTRLLLDPGQHVVGFSGIGPKILGSVTLDLTPGSDVNIVCFSKGSGIEASLTPVDVCSLPESSLSAQPASGGSGFFCMVFGLILLLLGLYILGVRLKLFVFLVPIK